MPGGGGGGGGVAGEGDGRYSYIGMFHSIGHIVSGS